MKIDSFPFAIDLVDNVYHVYMELKLNGVGVKIFDYVTETETNVLLATDTEAEKLLDELEDPDGVLCHLSDSICNKYPALEVFKP